MKKELVKCQFLLIILLLQAGACIAQISFQAGHYIAEDDKQLNGLIKNQDWRFNPSYIEFKPSGESETSQVDIEEIREFVIYDASKYIKSNVRIDRSSPLIKRLSDTRQAEFTNEQLLLKVLIEGDASLYEYRDKNITRFFYKKGKSNIEQLVYKKYKTRENNIGVNNRYKQQIENDLECRKKNLCDLSKLEYRRKRLIRHFVEYNECVRADYVNYAQAKNTDFINLSLRPRIRNSSLYIDKTSSPDYSSDVGSELSLGFGIEIECPLPFNNRKWAILIEGVYQKYKSEHLAEGIQNVSGGKLISIVDYESIEIPVGFRHYFFLSPSARAFLNASYTFDVNFPSTIVYNRADNSNFRTLDINSLYNLAFGAGYKLNKLSLELRYQMNRELLNFAVISSTNYNTLELIFGYEIL